MPTAVASIGREHVEAFIAAELVRTAPSSAPTRYRSLQQFFKWPDDEGEISGSPMVKLRPPMILEQPVPVLSDDQVRGLLAACSRKDFRDRRDTAIIRLFLDTGMRLEGMGGLRYSAEDADLSDVVFRSLVMCIIAKGRREMVLWIGTKVARYIDQVHPRPRRSSPRDRPVAVARQEGAAHAERRRPDDKGSR